MNIFLIGFLLFSLSAAIRGQEVCYGIQSGINISPGSNDISNSVKSLGDCCNQCVTTPACKAYVWNEVSSICYLKSANGPQVAQSQSIAGFPSFADAWNSNSDGQCSGVTSGTNITPGSNDISNTPNLDLGACCNLCKTTSGCKGYVWNTADSICYLKSATGPTTPAADSIIGYPIELVEDCRVLGLPEHVCAKPQAARTQCCKSQGYTGGVCIIGYLYCSTTD